MILRDFICIEYNILLVFSHLHSISLCLILPLLSLGFWHLRRLSSLIISFFPVSKLLAYVRAAYPPSVAKV